MIKLFEDKFFYKVCILSVYEGLWIKLILISCIMYIFLSIEFGLKFYFINYGGYFCGVFLNYVINMIVGC